MRWSLEASWKYASLRRAIRLSPVWYVSIVEAVGSRRRLVLVFTLAVDVPWRDRENEAGYCPKAKGEVEPTMPDTLPASLIEILNARDIVKARGAREK